MIVAATGHRPDKLGGYSEDVRQALFNLAYKHLENTPEITSVISGMAQGWDTAMAEAAIASGLPLTAAIPFVGQDYVWPAEAAKRYKQLVDQATSVQIISKGGYSSKAMNTRNAWMVDHADYVLALWDGTPGGTANCVRYAKAKEVPVDNLWPMWLVEPKKWWGVEEDEEKWGGRKQIFSDPLIKLLKKKQAEEEDDDVPF